MYVLYTSEWTRRNARGDTDSNVSRVRRSDATRRSDLITYDDDVFLRRTAHVSHPLELTTETRESTNADFTQVPSSSIVFSSFTNVEFYATIVLYGVARLFATPTITRATDAVQEDKTVCEETTTKRRVV